MPAFVDQEGESLARNFKSSGMAEGVDWKPEAKLHHEKIEEPSCH